MDKYIIAALVSGTLSLISVFVTAAFIALNRQLSSKFEVLLETAKTQLAENKEARQRLFERRERMILDRVEMIEMAAQHFHLIREQFRKALESPPGTQHTDDLMKECSASHEVIRKLYAANSVRLPMELAGLLHDSAKVADQSNYIFHRILAKFHFTHDITTAEHATLINLKMDLEQQIEIFRSHRDQVMNDFFGDITPPLRFVRAPEVLHPKAREHGDSAAHTRKELIK